MNPPTAIGQLTRGTGAALGGAATGLAVLTGWWILAIVGSAGIAFAVHGPRPTHRALLGLVAGGVHLAITSLWVVRFSAAGAVALVALQAAGWAIAALAVSRRTRWPWPLAPALAISEWARSVWPLGGFPLSQLWLTQADSPVAALAPIAGPFGVSLAIVLAGAALVGMWGRHRAAFRTAVIVIVVVSAAGMMSVPKPVGSIEVAAVQGGDRRGVPAVHGDPGPLLRRQFELTRALGPDVDLVLWPESAVASRGPLPPADLEQLRTLADDLDVLLITGIVERFDRPGGPGWFHNAALAVDGSGAVDRYDKQIPVPFGERVPLRSLVARIVDLSLVPRDMVPGTGPPILHTGVGDVGVAISYENLFSRIGRDAVAHGAQIIVVPTLAVSYVTDEIPTQQLAAARMRARETGRDLAVVGSTGPTALIRADGSIAARAPLDVSRTVTATLERRAAITPAARVGNVPILLGAAIALVAAANPRLRIRALVQPTPSGPLAR